MIVGASLNGSGGEAAGRAYVYYGGTVVDAIPDVKLTGETAGDRFGLAVGAAGDVNADGFGDVIVGAYLNSAGGAGAGRAYVYFGGSVPNHIPELTFTGEAAGDEFGRAVGAAGDVNGDGLDDLIVGAPFNDAGGVGAGRSYVFGPTDVVGLDDAVHRLARARNWYGFAQSIQSAGEPPDLGGHGRSVSPAGFLIPTVALS